MIKTLVISAAFAVVYYSLWQRRYTWRCTWEKGTTCTIALMGMSMILTNPALDGVMGAALWRYTGWRDTENVLGHALLIAAAAGIMHTATSRYMYPNERHQLLTRWVHYPAAAALISLIIPFALAGHDAAMMDGSTWLSLYWLIQSSILTYLLGFAALIFLRLRTEPRHQKIADLYTVACVCGILSCTARLTPFVLPDFIFPGPTQLQLAVIVLKYAWIAGFAYTAARSWGWKTRHFQPESELVG